ncbi:MAG TPA: cupin domain-containing protein [Acidimicrobiales bacterium]|nr:cupin domain-containing protein [Acidimicrobiales bacterium]
MRTTVASDWGIEMRTFRRVETGHGRDGRAVIRSDGPPSHTVHAPGGIAVSELLWLDGPVRSIDDGRDRDGGGFPLEPPVGGASFRIISMPPPEPGADPDTTWLRVPSDDPGRPGMHTTDTLDYVVVIDGEIVLGLDDGDHRLGPGDVVIQRGTPHRWRVVGDRPCTYGVLMLRPDPGATPGATALHPRDSDTTAASGTARMRRLVTATDADGKSFVHSFGLPPVVFEPSGPAGVSLIDFWQSGGPLRSADQGGDADSWELDPVGGGICCRSPQLPAGMDMGDRGWHATHTIDLNLVLRGRLELALPDGITTELDVGETVVQRGTNHRWRPVGDEPTTWFAVMFAVGAS